MLGRKERKLREVIDKFQRTEGSHTPLRFNEKSIREGNFGPMFRLALTCINYLNEKDKRRISKIRKSFRKLILQNPAALKFDDVQRTGEILGIIPTRKSGRKFLEYSGKITCWECGGRAEEKQGTIACSKCENCSVSSPTPLLKNCS